MNEAERAANLLDSIADLMVAFRKVRNLTQGEAAIQAGVPRSTWHRIEAGYLGYNARTAVKILRWLGEGS
jgi:DNA-binding XRE family transcriptional regulator